MKRVKFMMEMDDKIINIQVMHTFEIYLELYPSILELVGKNNQDERRRRNRTIYA